MIYLENIIWLLLFLSLHLSDKYFPISQWIFYGALLLISLSLLFKKNIRINKSASIAIAGLLFLSLIIRILFQGNIYGTYAIYLLLAYWLVFFIWIVQFNENKSNIKTIAGIIIVTVVIEIVWGFGQLFGFIENNNEYFLLGGSFGNPNAYSGFLSVISPLILSLLLTYRRKKKAENLYYFLMGCLLLIAFLLVISKSRGAWIAAGLGCLLVTNNYFLLTDKLKNILHTPTRRIIATVCALMIVSIAGYSLYQLKARSADGRLLVWKIVNQTPSSFVGNGIGCVEANYGKWQAAYFASGKGTDAERYVADYVTCAYNDFMEMGIDQGRGITVIFVFVLYFAFRQRSKVTSSLFIGAKASLTAITVWMLVSYPLAIPAIYLYFIFCLAVVFHEKKNCISWKGAKWCIPVFGLLIALMGGYMLYGYFQLRKGQELVFTGQLDKGIETYRKAEPILKNNGLFYFYYGSALFQKQEYQNSTEKLEIAVNKSSDPNIFTLLGNDYKELGQLDKAKENYLVAINMIPSRLYSKYLLTQLLIESHEYEAAEKWANEILNTKEKMPTTAAKEIKEEMKTFLKDRNY